MTPSVRARVVDAMVGRVPECGFTIHCDNCDPSGGCPDTTDCLTFMAERLLAVIERERGEAL